MRYRTRIRQLPVAPGQAGAWIVEAYLAGVGWLPLADGSGRKAQTFSSRKAARGHAGLELESRQLLGTKHLRWS